MNLLKVSLIILSLLVTVISNAQNQLVKELENNMFNFSLDEKNQFTGQVADYLGNEVRNAQFVGLAELHRSEQLSYFTIGLLSILKDAGYKNFALEIGPYSAHYLHQLSSKPTDTKNKISKINKIYGNRIFGNMVPIIFIDREEDALFIDKAVNEDFNFWGLDQEYAYSFEMHLDTIFAYHQSPSPELKDSYMQLKKNISTMLRKSAFSKKYNHYCELLESEALDRFFKKFQKINKAQKHIDDFYVSLDIYCKNTRGINSNQLRADYMKANFDEYFEDALSDKPRVFVKMGSVHLTRGKSPFGVNDLGKYLTEKAAGNETEFLSIRHLRRYKNGKDYVDKNSWESVSNFMRIGEKKRWTMVDLRPLRKKIKSGELKVTEREGYEIFSYDLLVIPPNDDKAKKNF